MSKFDYRFQDYAQKGDLMTIGVTLEAIALNGWFVQGDTVKVIRVDGHGVLVEHLIHQGLMVYVQPADLYPLGTTFDYAEPLTPLEAYARKSAMLETRAAVIIVVGLLTILILFSCFPQGL